MMLDTLIAPDNHFALLATLAAVAWLGVTGDRRGWFKKLSGILVAMSISALLASVGLIPAASNERVPVAVYGGILHYFVLLAILLLLLNVNLKKIKAESGRMLGIFLIGAAGVMVGGIVAGLVVPLPHTDAWKLGGILTGTYIGGSMNFMALSTLYGYTSSPLFPSAVMADNILTNVYLFILLLLPGLRWLAAKFVPWREAPAPEPAALAEASATSFSLTEKLLCCLALSAAITALGNGLGGYVQQLTGSDTKLSVLLVTVLAVLLANLFPRWLRPLQEVAFDAGLFMLYMFLAVVGTNADFRQLLSTAPQVFAMVGIVMGIHLLVVLVLGKLFRYSLHEIGLSSCANISGPPVCVPLAAAYKTPSLVTPVILVAVLGYALGNVAGFLVGWLLR
jgi:uncharacterized membrane protein